LPPRDIVYTEASGTLNGRDRQPATHAQEGTTAHGHTSATAELDASGPAQGATTPGRRSVKIRREPRPLAPKNFHTPHGHTTRSRAHGRSATVRQ
jgi:hypothetical protein